MLNNLYNLSRLPVNEYLAQALRRSDVNRRIAEPDDAFRTSDRRPIRADRLEQQPALIEVREEMHPARARKLEHADRQLRFPVGRIRRRERGRPGRRVGAPSIKAIPATTRRLFM